MDSLLSGIIFQLDGEIKLTDALREFLGYDNQGIEGLDFMLKDVKLSKRIPKDVRMEYEAIYGNLSYLLQSRIDEIRKALQELEENPKPVIHSMIQLLYEEEA